MLAVALMCDGKALLTPDMIADWDQEIRQSKVLAEYRVAQISWSCFSSIVAEDDDDNWGQKGAAWRSLVSSACDR